MCDDLRADHLFTEHSPPEEIPPCEKEPFVWWPPGFLDEEQNSPPSQQGGEAPAPSQEEPDILSRRLSRAYRIIDEQTGQLTQLSQQLEQLKQEQQEERAQQEKQRRRTRQLTLFFANVLILSSGLVWHREVSQVGWNCFHQLCQIINTPPEDVVGFLTAIAAVWLLYQLSKWVWRCAAEDLLNEEEDNDL